VKCTVNVASTAVDLEIGITAEGTRSYEPESYNTVS